MTEALLYLLPLLALLVPLLRGRFVGERTIAVLRERLAGLRPDSPGTPGRPCPSMPRSASAHSACWPAARA